MKRKHQACSERQACFSRRSARLASLLTEKQLKAPICDFSRPPTNLSGGSSCSSVFSAAPMSKRKGAGSSCSAAHMWTEVEERALLDEVEQLLETLLYTKNKKVFYDMLAISMNARFADNKGYVQLTGSRVKTKLSHYYQSWSAKAQMRTSIGTPITGRDDLFVKLFTITGRDSEGTSTGPLSAASGGISSMGVADMALKRERDANAIMARHGCSGIELYIFAGVLKDGTALSSFETIDTYEGKRRHLIELWKLGIVDVPVVQEVRDTLPPDMQ